ncbi:MAG TPA: hypothetical protein VF170_18300 [Planctomycetaceae bacterium]
MTRPERDGVYAILRFDGFHGPETPPEVAVTVKQVVRTQDIAEAEVTRLNALNGGKGVRYWWQFTRLFPLGESFGTHSP